jgi:ssDNA-binding Zn-finger/Zn-ribbon topoisomerase 1
MPNASKANQIIGTCPLCHDRLMAFEPAPGDAKHLECGGCGGHVTKSAIDNATAETGGSV